jgi:hypothetical protein
MGLIHLIGGCFGSSFRQQAGRSVITDKNEMKANRRMLR